MERGWGVHEGDTLEHATRHGTEDGRAAAEEWATAFLAGAVGLDELPEAVEEFGSPTMRDGSDLWDHTARTDSYDDDIANGGGSLSEDYRGAYNAAVRAVADEHGIELPEGFAPCRYHTLSILDIEAVPPTVTCEVCGYVEDADPRDVAERKHAQLADSEAMRHSVGCYFCGKQFDERLGGRADAYNGGDGGSVCPECLTRIPSTSLFRAFLSETVRSVMERNGLATFQEVNGGWCEEVSTAVEARFQPFAWELVETDCGDPAHGSMFDDVRHPETTLIHGTHSFVEFGGRYYDAEALDGVDEIHDLPFFRRDQAGHDQAQHDRGLAE